MTIWIRQNVPAVQRFSTFAMSCGLHGVCLGLALLGANAPQPHQPLYTLTMLPPRTPESEHIIWYNRPEKLPPVSSGKNARNPLLLAAEPERTQTITSSPNAPQGKEFIFVPDAPAQRQNPPDLPNMLVIAQKKLAPRKFEAPRPTRLPPADASVPLPPEVRAVQPVAAAKLPLELGSLGTAPRRPLRAFEEPRMKPSATPNVPAPPEPGTSRAAAGLGKLPAGLEGVAAPSGRPLRRFEPPPSRAGTSVATPGVAEPPALTAPASDLSVSAAVVRLDGRQNTASLPPLASQEARIAVGPAQPAHSDGKMSGTPGAIAISNLGIRGPSSASVANRSTATSELPASNVSPPPTVVVPRLPYQATSSVSAPQWPGARTVPALVEEQFRGRVVYKTLLTSTSSEDWVLWFGDREAVQPGTRLFMRPPVAVQPAGDLPRFVSPRQRVLLSGTLTTEGRVTAVVALVGPVPQALLDALGALRFTPAMRNGKTVEVTVVLEITGLD